MKTSDILSPFLLAASVNPFLIPVTQTSSVARYSAKQSDDIENQPQKWGILDETEKNKTLPEDKASNPFSPENYICENGVCRLKDDNVDVSEKSSSPLFATDTKSSSFTERLLKENTDIEKSR